MITRNDTARIIEALAPDCRCEVVHGDECSVGIGDVLFHADFSVCWDADYRKDIRNDLIDLWEEFGNKSLKEILADAEWEVNGCWDGKHGVPKAQCGGEHPNCKPITVLKGPAAELFELLDTFLSKEK